MKKHLFIFTVVLATLMACEKKPNGDDQIKENPNPTTINEFYLAKADIAADPDGFNMLTDGGFEHFIGDENWKQKSLYYLPDIVSEAQVPLNGQRSLYVDCGSEGWKDAAIQSFCVKKNKSYTLSVWYQGAWKGLNVYIGFQGSERKDINTNDPNENDIWKEYTFTLENTDDNKWEAFIGGWGWYNLWLEVDDMKVVPTGALNDSFKPYNGSILKSQLTNASFNEVQSAEKIVIWKEENGTFSGILHNVKMGTNTINNVFWTGKDNVKLVTIGTESVTNSALIPTAGITVNGTKYVNFYEYSGQTQLGEDDDPNTFEPDWTASGSVVYSSTDGKTWTETSLNWPSDSKFIKVAYVKQGNYVYMFGSPAGDQGRLTYLARVTTSNFGTLSAYEYWAGEEWVSDETLAVGIMYGPTDCMSVVYNASRYTYMIIYRSVTSGCIVYRDAGLPEGEWSGEKLLLADPNADTKLFAPQVIDISANEIQFVASKKQ